MLGEELFKYFGRQMLIYIEKYKEFDFEGEYDEVRIFY